MSDFKIENITKDNSPEESKSDWGILTIYIVREINKIPWAMITLIDGDFSGAGFQISDDPFFAVGEKIKISHSSYADDKPMFEGFVVKQDIRADSDRSFLTVELRDPAFVHTHHRESKAYSDDKSDKAIIEEIIKVSNIAMPENTFSPMVRYNCTDWDFVVSRSDVNGCCVLVKNGKIEVKDRKNFLGQQEDNGLSIHEISYEEKTIYDFHMEMDGREQYQKVSATLLNNKTFEGKSEDIEVEEKGLFTAQEQTVNYDNTEKFCRRKKILFHPVPSLNGEQEAKKWAESQFYKERLARLKGRLKMDGKKGEDAEKDIWPGDVIDIQNIAKRFDGKKIVTGVRHQISENGWYVEVQFGTSTDWFTARDDIEDLPAGGLLPAIHGLHIGKIIKRKCKYEIEKDEQFYIDYEVEFPITSEEQKENYTILARQIFTNRESQKFFEEKDIVILGFLNDDPRHAVILGVINHIDSFLSDFKEYEKK